METQLRLTRTSRMQETSSPLKSCLRQRFPPGVPNDGKSACVCCCIIYHCEREMSQSNIVLMSESCSDIVSVWCLKLIMPDAVFALRAREPSRTQNSWADYRLVPHSAVITSLNMRICMEITATRHVLHWKHAVPQEKNTSL